MQVKQSVTQHGATGHSLPFARSAGFPLCTDSAPRERQWGSSSAGCAGLRLCKFRPFGATSRRFSVAIPSPFSVFHSPFFIKNKIPSKWYCRGHASALPLHRNF
ncbi:MAG: hypothetical protein LBU42_07515 [Prevotellaceae bacterium]|nr:hypothetical protein [Prevotellaceae bacterium]